MGYGEGIATLGQATTLAVTADNGVVRGAEAAGRLSVMVWLLQVAIPGVYCKLPMALSALLEWSAQEIVSKVKSAPRGGLLIYPSVEVLGAPGLAIAAAHHYPAKGLQLN